MGFPSISISKETLRTLINVLISFNLIGSIFSSILIHEAIKTKMYVGDYINMISAYDGSLIAGVLAVIAVLATASHGFGAYLNFKLFPNGTKTHIQNLLFLNSITTCVLFVAIVCSMLVCVFHSRHMKNNIHNGIVNGMNKYRQDKSTKVQIDALQIRFKCCGSKSFKEWFYIPWLNPKFGGIVPTRTGEFVSDDVPFSCCSTETMRHCIHYKMMTSNAIYRYDPQRHISVSRIGCYSAIIAATRKLLKKIIYVLGAFALFQLLTSLMSRAVQTALSGGSVEDRDERFMSWIFGRSPMNKGTVEEVSDSEQSPLLEEETEETEEEEE